MFHKPHLGPLQPAPFSLQVVDGSETRPLGALEDMPVNIGDSWVLEDFIIVDMTKTNDAHIILGRPFLTTSGCTINVKGGDNI